MNILVVSVLHYHQGFMEWGGGGGGYVVSFPSSPDSINAKKEWDSRFPITWRGVASLAS